MLAGYDDTIVAVATAPGPSERGIVRLSGPRVAACLAAVFVPANSWPRSGNLPVCVHGQLTLSARLAAIPCHVLYWPGQKSYTRQPSAEIHLIGSAPLLNEVVTAVCRAGARLARPGEFTFRAFLAGRIDLSQVEAVLGIVDAQDENELKLALRQLAGGLSEPIQQLRNQLLDLLAHVEAGLDFVDEDIVFIEQSELLQHLQQAKDTVTCIENRLSDRTIVDGRFRVVLRGPPNVGKSSLFNALAGHQWALVSNEKGTTRDYLRAEVVWESTAIELVDTAGTEHANPEDIVGIEAQRRAAEAVGSAHLELYCQDALQPPIPELAVVNDVASAKQIVVWTKVDLAPQNFVPPHSKGVCVSSLTGEGIHQLKREILKRLSESVTMEILPVTFARCRGALTDAKAALERAITIVQHSGNEELVAAELRITLDALGRIVGAVYTDDLLDRIFSRFCIGK